MPIYAYKCDSCGFAKDVLQKISDPPLVQCPSCQAQTFKKQLTAAGFQLKGSGWYATDFKGSGSKAPATGDAKSDAQSDGKTDGKTDGKADSKSGASASTESGSATKTGSDTASTSTTATKKTDTTPSTGSGS